MRTVFALGLLASLVMVGWYGVVPSLFTDMGWSSGVVRSAPNWTAALAWFGAAVVFAALTGRSRRRGSSS